MAMFETFVGKGCFVFLDQFERRLYCIYFNEKGKRKRDLTTCGFFFFFLIETLRCALLNENCEYIVLESKRTTNVNKLTYES